MSKTRFRTATAAIDLIARIPRADPGRERSFFRFETRSYQASHVRAAGIAKPASLLLVLVVSLAVACSSTGSDGKGASQNTLDRDAQRTSAEVAAELDRTVTELRGTGGEIWGITVPGLAAAAITEDRLGDDPSAVVSGAADPPGDRPIERADRFHIGSATKTFTAALIMQLDQEGRLSLDEPISKWFKYENAANITVKMLLSHTSGIPNFLEVEGRTPDETPETLVALSELLPSEFDPGSSWKYSNTNYIMLGLIAQQVAGKTWRDQIETRFIEPLELTDTYIWTGEPIGPTVDGSRMACSGTGEPECELPESDLPLLAVTDGFDWKAAWSAGAIVSTPSDLVRWIRSLVSGDVLDAEHRELLTTPTPQSVESLSSTEPANPTLGEGDGTLRWTGYSLGLCRFEIEGEGVGWGHSGVINGFVSNVVQMMDSGHTVSLTSNFEYFDMRDGLGRLVIDIA